MPWLRGSEKSARDGKHRLPGRAAFTRTDIADSKRRAPDPSQDWRPYASVRGLDYLDSQNAGGYLTALPLDPRLQWNVMRGVLPGGRHGALFHELYALPVDRDGEPNESASLHNVVYNPGLRRNRGIVFDKDDPDPTFINALGVPTSAGTTNVPSAGLFPSGRVLIRNQTGSGWGRDKRPGFGGPWRMDGPALQPEVLERLQSGRMPRILAEMAGIPWVRISVEFGNVKLARSGFVATDVGWDQLATWIVALGDAVEEAVRPLTAPQPFDVPLPPRPAAAAGPDYILERPPSPWAEQLGAFAGDLRLAIEDPYSFHRAFPGLPVPGRAFAVQRGPIPGSSVIGRVVFTEDHSIWRRNDGYNAVLLPVAAGAAATAPGGIRLADGSTYAVADGVFALWRRRSGSDVHLGDVPALAAQALALGRELDVISG